jgi:hypothetical protein
MNSKNPLAASDAGSFPLRDKRRNEDKTNNDDRSRERSKALSTAITMLLSKKYDAG